MTLAVLITVTFGIGFVGVQASNSSSAIVNAFDLDPHIVGVVIALLAGLVIFSGTKAVGKLSSRIVPAMAFFWIIFTIGIIGMNFSNVGNAFAMIFEYAFSAPSLIGGGIGFIIMTGLKRGVFSNEAGLGSIANLAGTADTTHPVKQGLIQSFGVIVDTLIVCTFTAIAVLSFGNWEEIAALGLKGAPLVQEVASQALGTWAPSVIAIFLFVFAFTSMLGYYTMSEANLRYAKDNNNIIFIMRVIVILVAFASCLIDTGLMDLISDTFMAAMGAVNVIVVFLLSKPIGAYQLGETYAQNMGVNIKAFRAVLILLSSVLSATVTAFAGPISFVGVAVPHLMRSLFKTAKPIILIPACFLGGGVFCLLSDLIARTAFAPTELSISAVTALFGAPVVILVMLRRQREQL